MAETTEKSTDASLEFGLSPTPLGRGGLRSREQPLIIERLAFP